LHDAVSRGYFSMNGIDHTFPVSEEISHKLDDVKNELLSKPAVAEVTRTVTGSQKTMNTVAIFAGLLALILWLRD
jgi:hypothetical protein